MMDIRISEVKMQKTGSRQVAKAAHRKVQNSTTLSRKYVKRPVTQSSATAQIKRSPKVMHFNSAQQLPTPQKQDVMRKQMAARNQMEMEQPQNHPLQKTANMRMRARNSSIQKTQSHQPQRLTAKELKDQAIKKALASASATQSNLTKVATSESGTKKVGKMHFGIGRVVLALSCAAAAIFAIVYFVNLNMPDISLRVAAMQSGINATYPSHVPKDYAISSITSEDNKIILNFNNNRENQHFTLTEEKSAWDSNALLSNYVKEAYGENYSTIREQGVTIYINNSNAAWVNGGMVYKISAENGVLTEKQIRSIAVSL